MLKGLSNNYFQELKKVMKNKMNFQHSLMRSLSCKLTYLIPTRLQMKTTQSQISKII